MKKIAWLALWALAANATAVRAADDSNITGNTLFDACNALDDMAQQGFCVGYVVGVIEGIRWGAAVPMMRAELPLAEVDSGVDMFLGFCLPDGATWGQYRDVLMKYMTQNPNERHTSARLITQLALVEAFPCDLE